MAKFCTWCGAPLEPGARFCGECGGRILETVMVDGTKKQADELSGLDIVDGRKLPADATLRLDRDSLVVPTDTEPKRFSLDSAKKKRKTALVVLGAVIAVLAIVAIVLAAAYFGKADSQESEPMPVSKPEQSQQKAPSANDAGEGDGEKDEQDDAVREDEQDAQGKALTEDEVFNSISAAYDKLSVYDERIGGDGGLVEDFNGSFLANSMDVRTDAKETADKVLADLEADLEGLKAMEVSSSSAYTQQHADVMKLYEYQIGRVSALTEAWALDVTFETPSQHKDEILSIYTEKSSDGAQKYLTLYDELYTEAKPSKAS